MKIKVILVLFAALALLPVSRPFAGTEPPKRILAIQHQSFAPYERSFHGFEKGLEASDYSGVIEVVRFNAENNLGLLEEKLREVEAEKGFDLIFTLGTRATSMAIQAIGDIPIVFTDLGAPGYSGIIKDWKSSGTNVTGVETPKFIGKAVDILHQLVPFKKIGMLYLEGSPSHEGAVTQMKLISKNLGTTFFYDGFRLTDERGDAIPEEAIRRLITEKLEVLLPKVDVFFVQTSKTFFDNFDLFLDKFKEYKVFSAGDPIYIKDGVVLGLDRNKFEFGKQCAQYAVKIFRGTAPARLPMDVGQHFTISFNLKAAAVIGFTPPLYLLGAADAIYQDFEEKTIGETLGESLKVPLPEIDRESRAYAGIRTEVKETDSAEGVTFNLDRSTRKSE